MKIVQALVPPPPKKNHTLNTEIDLFINIAAFSERHNQTALLQISLTCI